MLRKLIGLLVAIALIYLAYLFFESQVEGGAGGNNPVLIIIAGAFLIWGMTRGGNLFKKSEPIPQEPSKIKGFFSTVFSVIFGFCLLLLIAWGIGEFL